MTAKEYIQKWIRVQSGVKLEENFQKKLPVYVWNRFQNRVYMNPSFRMKEAEEELLAEWEEEKPRIIRNALARLEADIRRNFKSTKLEEYAQIEEATGIALLDLTVDVAEGDQTFNLLSSSPSGRAYTQLSFNYDSHARIMRNGMGNAALDI